MRQLLDEAAKGGYGVGAFNVNNMEQIQSIMEAARETQCKKWLSALAVFTSRTPSTSPS
jgi:fructose/tagatose bisphosphate aldolase